MTSSLEKRVVTQRRAATYFIMIFFISKKASPSNKNIYRVDKKTWQDVKTARNKPSKHPKNAQYCLHAQPFFSVFFNEHHGIGFNFRGLKGKNVLFVQSLYTDFPLLAKGALIIIENGVHFAETAKLVPPDPSDLKSIVT